MVLLLKCAITECHDAFYFSVHSGYNLLRMSETVVLDNASKSRVVNLYLDA